MTYTVQTECHPVTETEARAVARVLRDGAASAARQGLEASGIAVGDLNCPICLVTFEPGEGFVFNGTAYTPRHTRPETVYPRDCPNFD